ncbi:hypothetical protein HUZ36_16085 [Pseudoalteromonas sp. McH1-7]|uniref:Uncharacterized protein n=1 Tax=Pseudoalteromonas peptidolytica F12-50-A1 TaxID=1315280 RepID=A0A8I0T1N1_9GAMM|nr:MULTISPECIES: hypothetical protein [Pseudoalteromonas]MBE0344716.1 hypothetical protein [Pseudoalteromonas peptidolytica F12-50-A1]MDW7551234.1 hypothetical protein [Pseudoalteromonas peptidolytica]NLR14445.1 hypothetical protein [Pseudoalteromonas peptidolytica]NUZ12303.1 hypothetical protein [Pseudoalteromonas sp. McH1-7]RRS10371.1 hypothetical protein EAG18_02095 [Pseudoalteromonas sp. J010]
MTRINEQVLGQLKQASIATIIGRYKASEEASHLLQPTLTPQQGVAVLLKADLERDAIQLIAHGLAVMNAIRWGLEIVKSYGANTDDEHKVLSCVESWLQSPSETLRIRAQQLAERVGLDNAFGWLAYSVFWSGTGSIVAPELPVVLPPENMVGHAINAAILLSMIDQ